MTREAWRDFAEKNSRFSIRTIQNRLAEVRGKDLSKVNVQRGSQYTREVKCSWCGGTKGTPAEGEKLCPSCKAAGDNGRKALSEPATRKTWSAEQVFDWLETKHPAIYALYQEKGFPRWIRLPKELRPKGWHAARPTPSQDVIHQIKA